MGRVQSVLLEGPGRAWLPGVLLLAATFGCSGARTESKRPSSATSESLPMPAESMSVPPLTELTRVEVDEALRAGLPKFLQELRLEAALEAGKFVGFRVVGFADRQKWAGVGLEIGDVVTKVNELPIERPEQAYVAFLALRTRSSLDVVYFRSGREMRLSLPIVGESAPAPVPSAAEAPPANVPAPSQPRPASR